MRSQSAEKSAFQHILLSLGLMPPSEDKCDLIFKMSTHTNTPICCHLVTLKILHIYGQIFIKNEMMLLMWAAEVEARLAWADTVFEVGI